MGIGDLVRDNGPGAWSHAAHFGGGFKYGFIVGERPSSRALNRLFKVLWRDGTVGDSVWDYDLKLVKDENR